MRRLNFLIVLIFIVSCEQRKSKFLASDYRIFENTPAWELAKSIKHSDITGIKREINKNPKLINYQEPMYGKSLIFLTIYNDDYEAFLILLESGANINLYDIERGESPIISVCGLNDDKYFKYLEKLVEYGANVNDKGKKIEFSQEATENSPLIIAAGEGNKKYVEFLISKGANIDYINDAGSNALGYSFLGGYYDIMYFLLLNNADCNVPLYNKYDEYGNSFPYYLKDAIEDKELQKHSLYYKIKQKIIEKGCDKVIQ